MKTLTLRRVTLATLVASVFVVCVHSHGTLVEPPARAVMSRYGFNVPVDNDPYGNNCGGIGTQYGAGGKRCGVCGDPYSQPQPRDHENGGKYGRGFIARTYRQGQTISVSVHMTAAHKGGVSFSLCPLTDRSRPAPDNCFDQYPVPFADGTGYLPLPFEWGNNYINTSLVLPARVTCDQCVLRWKYRAGNNWGCNADGTCCTGCGDVQEEFYACADIAILPSSGVPVTPSPVTPSPVTQFPVTQFPLTQAPTPRPVIPGLFPPYMVQPPPQQSEQTVLSQFPLFPLLSNSVQSPGQPSVPVVNPSLCPHAVCRIVCTSIASCPSFCPPSCRSR